ncbi:AraC family transcriptional regulator [Kaistia dalseonensis]|uniref:AraC family transcriptional regulator n=1 Tax=Kaistia dalseonensis TaxID=410840 RepID=A0ABU0HBU0_9HYPH|nr:AraC family transcriptional regulator [Kaistia dalseonensis]MCX5497151.1 AraC family transcriptional regulator [Kaistia dalseonensis]MDQ0439778.1 AraC family transcriptional regulator [Kaistia dalseonensis]
MLENPFASEAFAISRPALSGYAAVSRSGLTVEAYHSEAGQMLSCGAMHRISINRTAHRRYAFRLGEDGTTHTVKRPAFSLGFQPAGRPLFVDGDSADYISIFQDPDLYRSIAPGRFAPEEIDERALLMPTDPVTRHLACALAETASRPDGTDSMLSEQIGIAFAVSTVRLLTSGATIATTDRAPALSPQRLRRVSDYVDARLGETDLSISDLAAVANLSPFHFSRAFKGATGKTPHQFVTERRIEQAKAMMPNRECGLSEIAYAVGFSNQAHFSTVFRRVTGTTPKTYRDQL